MKGGVSPALFGILYMWLTSQAAFAELYLSGQIGQSFPNSVSDLHGVASNTGSNVGSILSDVGLRSGSVYGGKIGYYLPDLPWLGFEAEGYQSSLRVKQQGFTTRRPGSTSTGTLAETSFRMTTLALNLLVRYPGESLQPYAGVGVGLFTPSSNNITSNTTNPGLNALAGLRYKLQPYLALFAEWKYNRAPIDLKDPTNTTLQFNGTYSANMLVGGLSIHFNY
jgi:opacity protein-like surface antigen